MEPKYTTITGKPFCEACEFIEMGGSPKQAMLHTCGVDDSKWVDRNLKMLKKMNRIFKK